MTLTNNPAGTQGVGSLPFVTSQSVLDSTTGRFSNGLLRTEAKDQRCPVSGEFTALAASVNAARNERCVMQLLYNSNSDLQVV